MKTIILIFTLMLSLGLYAQVGINTQDPKSTLDVEGKPADKLVVDGLLIPRLSISQLEAKQSQYGLDQNGTIVFIDDATGGSNVTETDNIIGPGLYYWNNSDSEWKAAGETADDLYWDRDAGNQKVTLANIGDDVGIGSTSPDSKLDVQADIPLIRTTDNDNLVSNNSMYGGIGFAGSGGTLSSIIVVPVGNNDLNIRNNQPGGISFQTDGANDRMIIDENGDVGIGTTDPTDKFHVKGDANANADIEFFFDVNLGESPGIGLSEDGTGDLNWLIGANNSGNDLEFRENDAGFSSGWTGEGDVLMTIEDNGDVGIGTDNTGDARFDVQGISNGNIRFLFDNSTGEQPAIELSDNDTGGDVNWLIGANDSSNALEFVEGAGTNFTDSWEGNDEGDVRMIIDDGGFVGIGEEDPVSELHIYDDTGSTFVDVRSNDGEETGIRLRERQTSGSGVDLFYDGGQNTFFIEGVDSGSRNNSVFTFERNGNVGIGTDDPTQELEIGDYTDSEDIRLSGIDNDVNSGRIVFSETAAEDKAVIAYNSNSENLEFRNDQDGTVMTLERGSGNVGIGTTNPTDKFHVKGDDADGDIEFLFDGSFGESSGIGLSDDDGVGDVSWLIGANDSSNALEFRENGGNNFTDSWTGKGVVRMIIEEDGNVGIGVDDPDVKLQIDSVDPASISSFNSQSFEGTTGSWTRSQEPDPGSISGGAWQFETNNTGSTNTGPDGPSDGTEYIYAETSSPTAANDVFELVQTFDFTGRSGVTFSFDYHMYFDGANDGTLELIVNGSTEFTVTGQQQTDETDSYSTANVDLSAYDNQSGVTIAINFTTGSQSSTYEYDLAIDNIQIQEIFGGGTVLQLGEAGDVANGLANSWNTFSDKRWKKDIEQIPEVMEKIEKINGYYYKWKEGRNDKSRQIGVIAQEIQEVFPEAVSEDKDGYLSVDYSKLTAPLIEAVKTLSKKVNNQKQQINLLQEQNAKQQALIEEVSLRVQRLEGKE